MNSMRILILLTFVLYEMQNAQCTIKHLKYIKSLLMSKHLSSTTEQPIVEEEVYPMFVQCEPAEGDANINTPIELNPQALLTNEQKPVLIEIGNVETVPNVYPGQYYGISPSASPETNVGVNSGISYEGNPEANYMKIYEKDLNGEWLASQVKIEPKPELIDIKKGMVSLKDKVRQKINLIKSKLKLKHPEPKPITEIIDQDTSILSEQDNNNNNYFQYTTGKPITTVESISTGQPISIIESITTGRPISTIESITTGKPISTMEWITTGKPVSTMESITTGKPVTSTESFFSTEKPVTSTESFISTENPVTSTESVVSTGAEPVIVIKPIVKPHLFMNYDAGLRIKPFPPILPVVPQTPPHKLYYSYSPLPYHMWLNSNDNSCPPPLTQDMCRRQSIIQYAPNPWATTAKPLTLENTKYVMATGIGNQGKWQNQKPVVNQQQQPPTMTDKFGNYYYGIDQQQQLTAIGIDPTIINNPESHRLPYIANVPRPTKLPLTLQNMKYVIVAGTGNQGNLQTQRPGGIDQLAVVNRFENNYGGADQQAAIENSSTVQSGQPQQTPAVTDQQLSVTEFQNTYGNTVQTSYTPPTQAEVVTVVSTSGQPIAVYPNVTPSPAEESLPENEWNRDLASRIIPDQGITASNSPLRGDIALESDDSGAAQIAFGYEQDQDTKKERRQTKYDESMPVAMVNNHGSEKPAMPVFKESTEVNKKTVVA